MSRLALICAGGAFPSAVIANCNAPTPFLVLLKNLASDDLLTHEHVVISLAKITTIIDAIKAAGCNEVCFIGSLTRPPLLANLPDFATLKYLPRFLSGYKGGDNQLLSTLAEIFAENGLKLVGAHDIAPALLAPNGVWGKVQPTATDIASIAHAFKALDAMSQFDIGQGVVIHNNHIIAVEGAEGTDGLLRRVKDMRNANRFTWKMGEGLLVKALKQTQDARLDMPAIGYNTLKLAFEAGMKGVVVQAGGALVNDQTALIAFANHNNMLIMGASKP